jgi:hypothetical protein
MERVSRSSRSRSSRRARPRPPVQGEHGAILPDFPLFLRAGARLRNKVGANNRFDAPARPAIAATAVAPHARARWLEQLARKLDPRARWRARQRSGRADHCQRGSTCCWSAGSLCASMKSRVPPVNACPSHRATSRTLAAMTCDTSRTQPSSTLSAKTRTGRLYCASKRLRTMVEAGPGRTDRSRKERSAGLVRA